MLTSVKKVKNTVLWTYVISDLNSEEIGGMFYVKELQEKKGNQTEFRVAKVVQRKGDKVYVKMNGYNILINIWINKKDII